MVQSKFGTFLPIENVFAHIWVILRLSVIFNSQTMAASSSAQVLIKLYSCGIQKQARSLEALLIEKHLFVLNSTQLKISNIFFWLAVPTRKFFSLTQIQKTLFNNTKSTLDQLTRLLSLNMDVGLFQQQMIRRYMSGSLEFLWLQNTFLNPTCMQFQQLRCTQITSILLVNLWTTK